MHQKVSILVAARNESATIIRCLQSLTNLDFPKDQLEIWIGNDQSTDTTEAKVLEFIKDKPQFRYLNIEHQTHNLKGKANVLAQLAQAASGHYLFYCDADIAVGPSWVTSMIALFKPGDGVVVGVTRMTPGGMFAGMQSLEWLFSLAIMRFFSLFKIPFTGMGNNMAVTQEAYNSVGGYEKIGFSIVEDFTLFNEILTMGYSFSQGFGEQIVSVSIPARTLKEFFAQRKRWVNGAMNAPFLIRFSFYISALLLPLLLLFACFVPKLVISLTAIHLLCVISISWASLFILNQKDLFIYLPLFWLYFNVNNTLMLINFLLPSPTIWKGRRY